MPTPTEHSIADPDSLLEELSRIRARGYSIDDNEQELGVRCFAVAVPGMPSLTAISVSGPLTRVDEHFAERAIPILTHIAGLIAADVENAYRAS